MKSLFIKMKTYVDWCNLIQIIDTKEEKIQTQL